MKRKEIAEKRGTNWSATFLSLLLFSLFLSGCSYHDGQFSYFDMLDNEKRTLRNKKAAEKFWSSVRPVSTLPTSYYKLGRYYQQQGKYDKAIAEFAKALQNNSRFCKAYNGIAMSYDALKHCEKASDLYEQAIQCAPKEAYVYNNYGCSSLLCGDYEKGLALLYEAVQLSESNSRIRNNFQLAQRIAGIEKISDELGLKGAVVGLGRKKDPKSLGNDNDGLLSESHHRISPPLLMEWTEEAEPVDYITDVDHVEEPSTASTGFSAQPTIKGKETETLVSSSINGRGAGDKATASDSLSLLQQDRANSGIVEEEAKKITVQIRPIQTQPAGAQLTAAVEVSNGNGVTGMAGRSADYFRDRGFTIRRITNAINFHFAESVIFYREGYLPVAKELAMVIPGAQDLEKVDSLGRASIGVRVLLGKDLVNMDFPEGYVQNLVDYSRSGRWTQTILAN